MVTFEGIKYSYRQNKDGHVLAFVVHPANMPDAVALAPIGSRVMVTLTEIGDDEKPAEKPTEKPKPRQSWGSMSYAQRSGILRNDKRFQEWLGVDNPDDAADIIRRKCGVESCSKIDGIPLARQKFEVLDNQYRTATGLMAENRA